MQWFMELNGVLQAFLASVFTWFMTALGASLVFFSGKVNGRFLAATIGGAAGIMIAASFFSLLLPALEYEGGMPAYIAITVGFLLGGGFIAASGVLLSKTGSGKKERTEGKRRSALLYGAVTLHNIPEGMAIGVAFGAAGGVPAAVVAALMLAVGIGIQNFPEGVCVAYPLKAGGYSNFKAFFYSQISGAVEIPAAVFGACAAYIANEMMPWALSFSAGAMIAVVCAELIPDCFEKHKIIATIGVILGFALMMFLDISLG